LSFCHIFGTMSQQYFTVEQGLDVSVYSLQQELHKADLNLQLALAVNDTKGILDGKAAISILQQKQLRLKEKHSITPYSA
jgi:hypothetical protein